MEIMPAVYIVLAGVLGFIAWMYGKKKNEELTLNRAKIPRAVLEWENDVVAAAREFNVPVTILYAMLWVESAGNPAARGSAGEYGLMQLKEIAVRDLQANGYGNFRGWKTDPVQNIRAGAAFLALQKKRTGNWYEAVKAYNQGETGAQLYPERANAYLSKVRNKEQFFS